MMTRFHESCEYSVVLFARVAKAGKLLGLSPRQIEVTQLVSCGQTYKAIAAALKVSIKTVEIHIRFARLKAKAANNTQLIAICLASNGNP